MTTILILIMHGMPPKDFPKDKRAAFDRLRFDLSQKPEAATDEEKERLRILEEEMRRWPRNKKNDPYFEASGKLARALEAASGLDVILAFNEFCSPSAEEALREAAAQKPSKIILTTAMLTPGGSHAGREIPRVIDRAKKSYPEIRIEYGWPFRTEEVGGFIARELKRFL